MSVYVACPCMLHVVICFLWYFFHDTFVVHLGGSKGYKDTCFPKSVTFFPSFVDHMDIILLPNDRSLCGLSGAIGTLLGEWQEISVHM